MLKNQIEIRANVGEIPTITKLVIGPLINKNLTYRVEFQTNQFSKSITTQPY